MNFVLAQSWLEKARNVLITTHVRPDGDAVGALVALRNVLEHAARRAGRACAVQPAFLSDVPEAYRFLLAEEPWLLPRQLSDEDVRAGALDRFDCIVVADTSALVQLPHVGDYLRSRGQGVMVIDHHLATDELGQCRLVNPHASATGEIIFDLCRYAGWCLDPLTAAALFVAIATDTGWFRFENASSRAYEIGACLVAAGAQPAALHRRLFQSFPPARVRLLALALAGLELHADDRVALLHITRDMLARAGADRGLIENIVNEPQQIASVAVVGLLVEQDDGGTRLSLRSRGQVDVNAVAARFGGGGHAQAAGATLLEPLPAAREKLLAALLAALPPKT